MLERIYHNRHDQGTAERWRTTCLGFALWFSACGFVFADQAADPNVTIERLEAWTGVFSDSEQEFHFQIKCNDAFRGKAIWTYGANRRTLASGASPVAVGASQSARVTISLKIPEVKPGVVFRTTLNIAVHSEEGARESELVVPLWIFHANPFESRKVWLDALKITLFDPEGETLDRFDAAEIPCTPLRSFAALEDIDEGLVVIGEGTSLQTHRGLADVLMTLAAKGVTVLCLAPADGQFPWPGRGDILDGRDQAANTHRPNSISLRGPDIISELDKRLDATAWPPDGTMIQSGLEVRTDGEQPIAKVTNSRNSWPWFDARFRRGQGRLIVAGFGIIEHWDAGPAPRYLLARLFEELSTSERPKDRVPNHHKGK